jgi:hypothetical protein
VELADAAALPSAGLTAWQSLFDHAGLKERHVLAGDDGVRAAAVQAGLPDRAESIGPRELDAPVDVAAIDSQSGGSCPERRVCGLLPSRAAELIVPSPASAQ